MARRSLLETAITNHLETQGWGAPSLKVQRAAFPGVTPAHSSKGGSGRGAVVLDVERVDDSSGILLSYVASLKAAAKRKSTVTVTTGNPEHVDAVVKACEGGLDLPIIVVAMTSEIAGKGVNAEIAEHGPISVAVVNVGEMIRAHGVKQRAQGQGRGKGQAHPVSWGVKRQTYKATVYEYVSLAVNLPACGCTWTTLNSMDELAEFIESNSTGIPV